jgi:hypothetical protein
VGRGGLTRFTSLTTFPAMYTTGRGLTPESSSIQVIANNTGFDNFIFSSELRRFQTALYASVCADLSATIYLMCIQIVLYSLKGSTDHSAHSVHCCFLSTLDCRFAWRCGH